MGLRCRLSNCILESKTCGPIIFIDIFSCILVFRNDRVRPLPSLTCLCYVIDSLFWSGDAPPPPFCINTQRYHSPSSILQYHQPPTQTQLSSDVNNSLSPFSTMAFSTDAERLRYSQDLAAYTLRQFSEARSLLDQTKAAQLPEASSRDFSKLAAQLGTYFFRTNTVFYSLNVFYRSETGCTFQSHRSPSLNPPCDKTIPQMFMVV